MKGANVEFSEFTYTDWMIVKAVVMLAAIGAYGFWLGIPGR